MNILIEIYKNNAYEILSDIDIGTPMKETADGSVGQATIMFKSQVENAVELLQSVRITIGSNWRVSDEGFYNVASVKKTAIDSSLSSDALPVPTASGWGGMVAASLKPDADKTYYESYVDYQRCFIIADIQSDISQTGLYYKYIVTLMEPTKYLEKVFCPSMSLTNRNDSLKEQVEKVLLNAEPVEVGSMSRFRLSDSLIFSDVGGADFFFEKMNLREILDGIFAKIDSRCIVKEITDYNNIVIDAYPLNKRGKLINPIEFSKKRVVHNLEYLGADIESYAENAVTGSQKPIWQPSIGGWDTFKTYGATLTTENATIFTTFPVEKITRFIIKIPDSFNERIYFHGILGDTLGPILYTLHGDIDITRNIVDGETYKILEVGGSDSVKTEELYQENTIVFERGSNTATIEKYKYLLFFSTTNIERAIKNAFWNYPEVKAIRDLGEYPDYEDSWIVSPSIDQILFRIEYVPLFNAHLKIGKKKYIGPPATIINQQSDKIIDISRYGDNLQGLINRVGNKELYIDKIVDSVTELYELFDYTDDNYVLTSREIAVANDFLKVHYGFTENFSAQSTKIGIDRRKRVFNIPLENFKSDILIKEYIVANKGAEQNYDKIIERFIWTFYNETYLPFNMAVVKTYWGTNGESDYFELPVANFYAGNTLNFHFTFLDNASAGMSISNQILGGKKQIPNLYCNEFGEYDEIEIRLFNAASKSSVYNKDPDIAKLLPQTHISYYGTPPIIRRYQRKKDAYEHQSFTFCFEIKSEDPDIIIGPKLIEKCSFIMENGIDLFVYVSSDKYVVDDKMVKGDIASSSSIELEDGYITVDIQTSAIWAIGDENRNLYIACNDPNERSIRFTNKKEL